jgi:DNA transposition AAA+ family ATPase
VIARLGVRKSAWNPADVRGTVELLLAETGIYADTAARTELAEDITARALQHSVPLLTRADVPEHVRNYTSDHVLGTEAEILTRLADRAELPLTDHTPAAEPSTARRGMNRRPTHEPVRRTVRDRAVLALGLTNAPLVVVEGAAGSGKTSLLRNTQLVLKSRGHQMLVVTPTRKAAEVAARETGAGSHSATWLTYQYGFRRNLDGTIARPVPATPKPDAVLNPGDLLVVDEAGMLDQDTARELLQIADTTGARIAFIGDRHQLPAVGRGGVMNHAHTWAHPSTRFDLTEIHRFTDPTYAPIAAKIRYGEHPDLVFDQLVTRGQIVIHPTDLERTAVLADRAVTGQMVIADTRDVVTQLNATAQHTNRTMEEHSVITHAGERIGLGDRVATRRNDEYLQVANRQTWTVIGTTPNGGLIISQPGTRKPDRELPADYVRQHVELAYATTVYGAQGDTTQVAHLAVGDSTSRASAYVALTRGRSTNIAHLVAENLDEAKAQWVEIFERDRADLGPAAARTAAAQAVEQYGPTALRRRGEPSVPMRPPMRPPSPPTPSASSQGPVLGP